MRLLRPAIFYVKEAPFLVARFCQPGWKHTRLHSFRSAKEYQLKPFWKLDATSHNAVVKVDSIDEEKLVLIHEDGDECHVSVKEDPPSRTMTLDVSETGSLHISIPYQVDLNLLLKGQGMAKISDLENKYVNVKADKYDIEVKNIKSEIISVESDRGDIMAAKSLRGNTELRSARGDITTEKIQGNTASLTADTGSVTVGDVYAEDVSLVSASSIRIGSLHGDSEIQSTKGDIVIGTAEGRLNAITESGNIKIHLTDKVKHADLVTNTGDIDLSFSPDLSGQLDIEAQMINDDEASTLSGVRKHNRGPCTRYRAEMNDGDTKITVKSLGGMTKLRTSSWLEAVSLFKKANG